LSARETFAYRIVKVASRIIKRHLLIHHRSLAHSEQNSSQYTSRMNLLPITANDGNSYDTIGCSTKAVFKFELFILASDIVSVTSYVKNHQICFPSIYSSAYFRHDDP